MTAPGVPDWVVLAEFTRELFDRYRDDIEAARLTLRFELDPHLVVRRTPARESAFEDLVRLILATTPPESEIYSSCQRHSQSISRLGEGEWVARWQMRQEDPGLDFQEKRLTRLQLAFERVGCGLECAHVGAGREFRVRLSFDADVARR